MIQLINVKRGFVQATIVCDVCEQPIINASLAMVRWRNDERTQGPISTMLFTHKGTCDQSLSDRQSDSWWELGHFLARLLASVGMDARSMHVAMSQVDCTESTAKKPNCKHERVTAFPDHRLICCTCDEIFYNEDDLNEARARASGATGGPFD